jgi:signal transduction histidine kinase
VTRRWLGPVGGPLALLLVAGLAFAGLGWVTVAALRVEEAHRESARAADREKLLRIALWRLDARMLPALGVEDTRQFHEFKTFSPDDPITVYGPASAPLLVGDLPDWMQLHFQLDPDGAWESPQVLNSSQRTALKLNWPGMPLKNANKPREQQLAALNAKFPAKLVGELFASRDRSPPVLSPTPPFPTHTSGAFDMDGTAPREERSGAAPSPVIVEPVPDQKPGASTETLREGHKDKAPASAPPAIRKADDEGPFVQTAPAPKAAKEAAPQNALPLEPQSKADLSKKRADGGYDQRQLTIDSALGDAARFPYSLIPRAAFPNRKQLDDSADRYSAKNFTDALSKEAEFAKRLPNAEMKKVESDPYAFNRLLNEARTRAREHEQIDRLHRGDLNRAEDAEKKSDSKQEKESGLRGLAKGGSLGAPAKPAADASLTTLGRASAPAGGAPAPGGPAFGLGGGAGFGSPPPGPGSGPAKSRLSDPIPPTPDPEPPAMLVAEPPLKIPIAAVDDFAAPPLAVHLGTLRPQWLSAPDGTQLLVLVRTARIENRKTVYQGVVLDWAKLQTLLGDETKEAFPEAALVPVKEPGLESREFSMTALPVRLDPGPEPELPPAGWTPLRIGLVLAWVAAIVAFTAVGLTGLKVVDLANRRIRFVSAVTHELRTPLTSLRLYLDLLLSGMVQDEEKRREYLSTLNVESDRLHRLIDNVLDFAKLERNRKGRDLVAVKAADLVDSVRLTWTDRAAADGKELVVEHELSPDLGLLTDGSLVQQIVGNLIDNARKYTRESADIRIWLKARAESSSKLVIEVEDRGPGVPPGEQKTIFRPFRRGETADTKAGGAGLGLALSKEWAEVLGGSLSYRTPPGGVGSCFRLELPIRS